MTTLKERQARLDKIMPLVALDDAGGIVNRSETEARVRKKFGLSLDSSRMLVAQAARRLRHAREQSGAPDADRLSIPDAVRLASDLAGSGEIAKAPGRPAIARAVLLGRIPAEQDSGRRWSFPRGAFLAWLKDAAEHKPGRKTKPD